MSAFILKTKGCKCLRRLVRTLRYPPENNPFHPRLGRRNVLPLPLMVLALIGGLAFLVFISLAILDRIEAFKINR